METGIVEMSSGPLQGKELPEMQMKREVGGVAFLQNGGCRLWEGPQGMGWSPTERHQVSESTGPCHSSSLALSN